MNTFITKLEKKWSEKKFVCVGLDTDKNKIPKHLLSESDPIFAFNKALVDATADVVCAYKPNSAYYEATGASGMESLRRTVEYVKQTYPDIVLINDAKRADIGNTSEQYAISVFDYYNFDAITLHPYLGQDSLQPFLDRKDKGIIILVRTSNPGSGEFQDLVVDDKPLYQIVAEHVKGWNTHNNCAIVVGATYPQELKKVREIVGDMPILVPGVGKQGGSVSEVLKNGLNSKGQGVIINASRSVIYASNGEDFAQAARSEVEKLNAEIEKNL